MATDWSRRSLLAALGTGGVGALAGCPDTTASGRGATDIVLHNEATARLAVDVTVTDRDDDSVRVDERFELEPNERRKINNEVIMGADYDVEVSFTDGTDGSSPYSETYQWTNAGKPLHAILRDQVVFAVQVG
ncbi:hypothetical protein VB773_02770 [Haloarculaceae archaeon H-GB2-1]|nr:DUF6517 family protein [Haloarculaceae archaeon H-GB1-1]MEA5388558.1 hypothetical protein [Haloarculaceae archaeon H-GB11]MEA5406611.1 hypothetical protein [Haloarculaceae archaeon H-GB2-1]